MAELVCAVDVGTGSARAGIVDRAGRMLGRAEHPIAMHRSAAGHAEHDFGRHLVERLRGRSRRARTGRRVRW